MIEVRVISLDLLKPLQQFFITYDYGQKKRRAHLIVLEKKEAQIYAAFKVLGDDHYYDLPYKVVRFRKDQALSVDDDIRLYYTDDDGEWIEINGINKIEVVS